MPILKKTNNIATYLFYWYFETVCLGYLVLANLQKRFLQIRTIARSQ